MLSMIKLCIAYFISGRYSFKKLLFLFTSQYIIISPMVNLKAILFYKAILSNLTDTDMLHFQILMVVIVTVNQSCILL